MELRDALSDVLRGDPRVVAAWLFGSRARGTPRPDSDVDVAVLLDRAPAGFLDHPWELEARLAERVGLRVQLVVVNRAAADLVVRVLRDGHLLVDRDRAARLRFEVASRNTYYDMTPTWRRIRRLPPGVMP